MARSAAVRVHTIVFIQRIVQSTLVFVLIIVVVIHDGSAGAVPIPCRTRLTRCDDFVFVVGRFCVVDGFLGLGKKALSVAVGWEEGFYRMGRTLREGLLLASTAGEVAGWLSSSAGDFGDGKESLGTFESMVMTSTFSWELNGSAASLLGTGVMLGGRLAKDKELAFVVSLRHVDDALAVLVEVDGVAVAEAEVAEAGAAALGFGFGWLALEKKPKMLCCFALDDGVFAGVRAEALAGFSPIFS